MSNPLSRFAPFALCAGLAACLGLAGCASAPHISAYQEAMLAPAPRTLALAIEPDEALPFGIARSDLIRGAEQAGFVIGSDAPPRYRLYLTAAAGSAGAGTYLPAAETRTPPELVARSDHSLRGRVGGGGVMRITAVLVDTVVNREVWRGTGTMRSRALATAAHDLVGQLLAKLPRA